MALKTQLAKALEPVPAISRMARWHRGGLPAVAAWIWWLVLAGWMALGLAWGALHFFIVPRIAELRPWLEQQASQQLGVPLRLGAIVARSNGMVPSVELRDVQLLDAQGQVALRLPLVVAALSLRSALGWGFEQLYIDSPELDVRRSADGRIWVAGFELPTTHSGNRSASDWLFSQTELVLRHGTLRWSDELRSQPTLQLGDVDLVIRKRLLRHSIRIDAKAPASWGTRLSLMGQFQQPLLTRHPGDWRNWVGQVFADADQLDLAQLRNYVDLGGQWDLTQGSGSLRVWLDVKHSRISSATADLDLQAVSVRLATDLEPLELLHITGRLGIKQSKMGQELLAQNLRFDTRDGLHWPGGNLQLNLTDADAPAHKPAHGSLRADRLELAATSQVASRLPLDAKLRSTLRRLAPQGQVDSLQLDWQGEWPAPQSFAAKGRVSQLALASQPADQAGKLGVPGLRGASVDFDFNQGGGKALLTMQDGSMDFPGVFDQPLVPFDTLRGELRWQHDARRIQVQASKLRFANADAEGEVQIKWQNAQMPPGASLASGTPGLLDLQGSLRRARVAAVPRYLPITMSQAARDYLAQALVAGDGSNVRFKVRGNLEQFPFAEEKTGEFRIAADIRNASYAYLPTTLEPQDSTPWPMLSQVSTEMLLDRDQLHFKAGKGLLVAGGNLPFNKTEVSLSHLYSATVVDVSTDVHGPLAEALAFVNSTPVGSWIGHALAHSRAQGQADYRVKLGIPLDQPDKTTVQGTVLLGNSDFQFSADVPPISHIKGQVAFSETGFALTDVQGRALGGDVRLEGGMVFGSTAAARNAPTGLRIQGTATVEGLRQAPELGLGQRLALFASGGAAYSVNINLHSGVPEWLVSSNLIGMELNLPGPFTKAADSSWPLRVESALVRGTEQEGQRMQDQWQVQLGRLLNLRYVRDIADQQPKVLRGAIALGLQGDESASLPAEGVAANAHLDEVDADTWLAVAKRIAESEPDNNSSSSVEAATPNRNSPYLPTRLALRANALSLGGRTFSEVQLSGEHESGVWRGNVNAAQLKGYVEYRQNSDGAPGRVYARLEHVKLGSAAQQDVENLLDRQPASVPALDIVVEDLQLHGKNLGRVEIQATNIGGAPKPGATAAGCCNCAQPDGSGTQQDACGATAQREWRLDHFNISTPEAVFSATGNWARVNPQLAVADFSLRERRRTLLNFRLDINDSGALLKRLGMPDVIAKGRGQVQGQVAWLGSPFSPDYPSMAGGFNLDMESGQFLKAEPGIAKLLGVLSLQSLPRRLTLDFRDVFSDGFSFDFVRGDARIEQGIAHTSNLQMKGVNAKVLMEGQADLARETQTLKVVVVPEINVASASLLYSAINPAVGLSTFLANLVLRGPLVNANTQEFHIDGSWVNPQVRSVERKP